MDKCFILVTSSSKFFLQEHIWIRLEDKASVNTKLTCFLTIPAAKDVNCTIKTEIIKNLLSKSMLMTYITLLTGVNFE